MNRSIAQATLALVLGFSTACSKPSATVANPAEGFAARVDALRVENRIPGLAVVVVRDGAVIESRSFGFADIERQVAVTPDTPFDIASVTKTISAVVALRLSELGQLDLDAPMDSFDGFAEFAAEAKKSGGIFFQDFADGPTPLTVRHVLSMSANGDPGSRFFYNPPSYSWASRPMAQAGRKSFSDLNTEHVLVPAGMTRSARRHRKRPLPAELAGSLAQPYLVDDVGHFVRAEPPSPQGDGAAGGIVASAADLARFDVALDEGRLITAESRRIMWTPGRTPAGATRPYGLGWFVREHRGETVVWHTGLWEGKYSALYLKVPARKLSLILLANSEGLKWESKFDEAAVERSPFANAFLDAFLN